MRRLDIKHNNSDNRFKTIQINQKLGTVKISTIENTSENMEQEI